MAEKKEKPKKEGKGGDSAMRRYSKTPRIGPQPKEHAPDEEKSGTPKEQGTDGSPHLGKEETDAAPVADRLAGTDHTMHTQHAHERDDLHGRHMREHMDMHHRHHKEHAARAAGTHHEDHTAMHSRHHAERREAHTRHEREMKDMHERHSAAHGEEKGGKKEKA